MSQFMCPLVFRMSLSQEKQPVNGVAIALNAQEIRGKREHYDRMTNCPHEGISVE